MTLLRCNHYALITKKYSTEIVQRLSKRNRFSIERSTKFVGYIRCLTVISHPGIKKANTFKVNAQNFSNFQMLTISIHNTM